MTKPKKPAGPAPDRAALHEAALRHLARFACTEAGLVRVLDRAVLRWARTATAEGMEVEQAVQAGRPAVRQVAAALVQSGLIDDAAFAERRAARLLRGGRSRSLVSTHLAARGVSREAVGAALSSGPEDFVVALAYARRRRLGPFRVDAAPESRLRDLAALARAGFPHAVAERVLALGADEADRALAGSAGG